MINWYNLIAFTFWIVTIVLLSVNNVKLRRQLTQNSVLMIQQRIDRSELEKKIAELHKKQSEQELVQTDGFLKFVSDSRDWAFQYIEEVQTSLSEFDKKIVPILEWESTYGLVNGTNPHSDNMKKISEAYDKLKTVLPKETETPNN